MRRADIARVSTVTSGADYISTLLDQRARGRRLVATINSFRLRTVDRYLGPKASVVTGSLAGADYVSGLTPDRLPTVLPTVHTLGVTVRGSPL